jgi:hypothetical protein
LIAYDFVSVDTQLIRLQNKTANKNIFLKNVKRVSHNRPGQAQRVPGRLRPRIFLMFGIARVVGRQPYALAAFTPGEIPGTHF